MTTYERLMTSLGGMATAGILALGLGAPSALAQSQEEIPLLPPNAKPGECYARVLVPEQYQTTTQRVLQREGGEQVEVAPAKFETIEQEILVKEASSILEVVPARFETREEQVVVKPAETRLEAVPAQYETVTEEVLIKPGYTTWKLGRGPIETIDAATGEIMCLVEVPPEYATLEKTVLRSPATVRAVEIPAEVITVTKEVMVEPPTTTSVDVPPEYDTVTVQRLVEPAREMRVPIDPEFIEVTQTAKVADSYLEWRPILCETNTTPDVVQRLQVALNDAGYDAGPADGSLGGKTLEAVQAFQLDQGIASGQLTMETLERLDVSP
jgi:Putative peptidoglycan binding domain